MDTILKEQIWTIKEIGFHCLMKTVNHQFESVFTKGDNTTNIPALEGDQYPDIPRLSIDVHGMHKLLTQLKVSKASGPDGLPNRVLKELANQLAPVLTILFQQSIETNILPEDWRNANVTPIFKKGDRYKAVNYRPVSLTCVCCKLLEHIVCSHIHAHLDKYNILTHMHSSVFDFCFFSVIFSKSFWA
jgi:hypothetical protein